MESRPTRIVDRIALIANVGILLGLLLVAYEIRQNSLLTEATLLDSRFNFNIGLDHMALGEDPLASLVRAEQAPEAITDYDFQTIDRIYMGHVNSVLRIKALGEMGVVDPKAWLNYFPDENGIIAANRLAQRIGNPSGRAWFRAVEAGRGLGDEELRDAVRRLMAWSKQNESRMRTNYQRFLQEELNAAPAKAPER